MNNHIEDFHIEYCKAFNHTQFLLLQKYKIFDKFVELSWFVYDSKSQKISQLADDFSEIAFCWRDKYISLCHTPKLDEYRYVAHNGKTFVATNTNVQKGDKLCVLKDNKIFSFDENLNLLETCAYVSYRDFEVSQPEYAPEEFANRDFMPSLSLVDDSTIYFRKRFSNEISIHYFGGKTACIINLEVENDYLIIDAVYYNFSFYLLKSKTSKIYLSRYDCNSKLIEEKVFKGYDAHFNFLNDKLFLLYDDHKEWTKEQKGCYPEFITGKQP